MDFLIALSQDICGSKITWQFCHTGLFFSFLEAVTLQCLLWTWIFWVNFTRLTGWPLCERESYSSFTLPGCPHHSAACSAGQNKQHSQLNTIWPGQWNHGVNQTLRQSDFPEGTLLGPIFFSAWSPSSPAEWEQVLFCFFQLSAPYLHLWSYSCDSLCAGSLLCWPKCTRWCQLSGISIQWIQIKKKKKNRTEIKERYSHCTDCTVWHRTESLWLMLWNCYFPLL